MAIPVLATKLYLPTPHPKIVTRSRLINRLNEGLSVGRKLTLISAPAGFGKTTLVSEWVANCEKPAAWLSLDNGDKDLARFLTYFITALQTIAPNIGEKALGIIQSPYLPPIESLLIDLLNEISALPHQFIFVLDDYHLIDSGPVDQVLTYLVENLPLPMQLVITTREDPPLPLARLRARNQLTELRAATLRFTTAEAAEFLNRAEGLNLSPEDIASLEARTEGWIAGLQLAALSMQGQQDIHHFVQSFSGVHHFVLDYLLEEVLQQQPIAIQTFLLQTSILNRLCGPLCDMLLQAQAGSGQETLEYLERANLFLVSLDHEQHWYRYHHLFGDLLRQRLGQNQTPEEIAAFQIRASEWFEKNGDNAEAFQHAIAARDFSRAAKLAEIAWEGMNGTFQSAAWLRWVKQLPEDLIRGRPVLCAQIAAALTDVGDVEASESRLQDAEQALEISHAEVAEIDKKLFRALPARIAFTRTYNAQIRGDLDAAVRFAQQALDLTPKDEHFMRAQTMAVLGSAYWGRGELEPASRALQDWIENAKNAGNFSFAIASGSGLADILIAQGHLHEAVQVYQRSLALASSHDTEAQSVIAHHYLGLAMLYHEMGITEAASQHFQKSIELGPQSTLVDWPYRKCLAQAQWKESEGDLDAVLDLLDEAKRVYVRTPIPDARPIEALKARIYLKQGRLAKAQEWARGHPLSVQDKPSFLREFEQVTLARLLICEYQQTQDQQALRDALHLLERLLDAAEAANRTGSMIEILLAQAFAFQAGKDAPRALAALSRALILAEPEGYFRVFVNEGMSLADLLHGLDGQHETRSLKKYIQRLLDAIESRGSHPAPSNLIVEPLSERELEVLHLVAQGLSNGEISRKLFLSLSTVKGHNLRIFAKLQAKSRTEAVARARDLGLL